MANPAAQNEEQKKWPSAPPESFEPTVLMSRMEILQRLQKTRDWDAAFEDTAWDLPSPPNEIVGGAPLWAGLKKREEIELPTQRTRTKMEYVRTKGIPVRYTDPDNQERKGKLVEWENTEKFVVIGIEEDNVVKRTFDAKALYGLNEDLGRQMRDFANASEETRDRLFTSVVEDLERKRIRNQHIDNGRDAETLEEAVRLFELDDGRIEGAAATCIAGYKYEKGKDGRPKNINEDRWIVNPKTGFVGVVDGMGGGQKGSLAAQLTAEELGDNEDDVIAGAQTAKAEMSKLDFSGSDGACFMTIKPKANEVIDAYQCGDLDLYHFSGNGEVKYRPGQQFERGGTFHTAFEFLGYMVKNFSEEQIRGVVLSMAKKAVKDMSEDEKQGVETVIQRMLADKASPSPDNKPYVERSNPMFRSFRKVPAKAVTKNEADVEHFQTEQPVEKGDWILLMSDGVSDNFLEGEIEMAVQKAIEKGLSPEQFVKQLSDTLEERLKLKADGDPMAEENHLKLDNATIVAMRVKG